MRRNKNITPPLAESEIIDNYIKNLEKQEKKYRHKKRLPDFKRKRRFWIPVLITLLLIILAAGFMYFKGINPINWFKADTKEVVELSSETLTEPDVSTLEETPENTSNAERPSKFFSTTLNLDVDFSLTSPQNELDNLFIDLQKNGFTAAFIPLNSNIGLFTDTEEGKAIITALKSAARPNGISLFGVLDVSLLAGDDLATLQSAEIINQKSTELAQLEGLDGIILKGVERSGAENDFKNYLSVGTLSGFKNYRENLLNHLVSEVSANVRKTNPAKLFGLICDSVYSTKEVDENGLDVKSDSQLLRDKNADVLLWMNKGYFDIVFINANTTTNTTALPFDAVINWWNTNTPANCDVGFILSSELALKGEGDWKNPDQLGRQLKILNETNRYVFCFDSNDALKKETRGGTALVYKYINGELDDEYIMRELSITSPKKISFVTYENTTSIVGASDPNFALTLNGKDVERTDDGYFSLDLDLKVGKNTFTFEHKGTTKTYTITYRYVVIKSFTPSSALTREGNSSIVVSAVARVGSKVTATLNGQTVTLEMTEDQEYSDFATYQGTVVLPPSTEKDVSLGKIVFKGTHSGITESFTGGKITVKKKPPEPSSNQNVTDGPTNSGGYMAVGNKLVAEVVKYQIETFDGNNTNDLSQPYNSYLPKGTLDYASENTIYDSSSGNTYRLLGYGKRVYTQSKGIDNIRTMRGSLPATNKINVKSIKTEGTHTTFTLKTDWRAPFKLEISPQKYQSTTGSARGTISSATFNYVDITFCYSSAFDCNIDEFAKSPIFSKAQLIKNTADYTLRLYLEKTGAFYGWTANYNSDGDLVFDFLNPAKATKANNAYGGRLDGITIVVDAGHGGTDCGAVGSILGNNNTYTEAGRNLYLAKMVEERLTSIGAKVVMTRTSDSSLTFDERILKVKNAKPNMAISIHRNAATKSTARGFSAHYYNAYTKFLADKITNATSKTNTYTKYETKWHVFFLSRVSDCPVALTENGFMSNSADFTNIRDENWNKKCADAIVQGIVDYFLAI